jgi:hypothetical protein
LSDKSPTEVQVLLNAIFSTVRMCHARGARKQLSCNFTSNNCFQARLLSRLNNDIAQAACTSVRTLLPDSVLTVSRLTGRQLQRTSAASTLHLFEDAERLLLHKIKYPRRHLIGIPPAQHTAYRRGAKA